MSKTTILTVLLLFVMLAGIGNASYIFTTSPSDVPGLDNVGVTGAVITIAAAETSDTDQLVAASKNMLNTTTNLLIRSSGAGSSTFIAQPEVCRNIVATMNASTTASMKLTGTNIANDAITENLTWTGESGAKASTKAFKTVTRIDATISGASRQVIIGTGDLLGLNTMFVTNPVVYCALDDTREATAPAVTVSATDLSLNTIDTSTAPGGHVLKVWVLY